MWNPDDIELPNKTTAEMGLYVIDDATSYVVYTSTGEQLEFDTFNGAEAFCVKNIQGGVEWITPELTGAALAPHVSRCVEAASS